MSNAPIGGGLLLSYRAAFSRIIRPAIIRYA